ncbi:3-oxoacyl-[acyl-carrier protein] reductase [hydrothermal vent metagenome]|uniref:3-oxoacyl-[acyl-carrier protein] reductase n=1 Tax=hydrothermal vent metagenome TaxID=652676 RepID=A0A3B1B0Y5_9ZZZZ
MFKNGIAFVTGASRGIGKAIAEGLGAQGATVIGTATTQAGADAISERLAVEGISGSGLVLNVADQESVDAGMQFIKDNFGAPTILVNNAGVTQDNLLMRMKEHEWQSVIDTDLTSVYRLSKACLRGMMKARSGRIINISSIVGATGNPGQANYCAAKAGMIGFTKSLAREVGTRGITVNAVAPGFIATDMTNELPEEQKNALLAGVPLARLGTPGEIANAVIFLASPNASYITGETLHVNGGMYMG